MVSAVLSVGVAGEDDTDKAVDESSRWRSAESATLALPCQF
jgi:hypothetical protein